MSIFAGIGLTVGGVVVNEFELKPPSNDPFATEWVELFNSGSEDMDISGWQLSILSTVPNDAGSEFIWSGTINVPDGTVLKAGGYRVLNGERAWEHGINATAVLYTRTGEEVDRTPLLTDDRADGSDWSRYPNGVDTDRTGDWAYIPSTKGSANLLPYN